jgi:hypothetical protein
MKVTLISHDVLPSFLFMLHGQIIDTLSTRDLLTRKSFEALHIIVPAEFVFWLIINFSYINKKFTIFFMKYAIPLS